MATNRGIDQMSNNKHVPIGDEKRMCDAKNFKGRNSNIVTSDFVMAELLRTGKPKIAFRIDSNSAFLSNEISVLSDNKIHIMISGQSAQINYR